MYPELVDQVSCNFQFHQVDEEYVRYYNYLLDNNSFYNTDFGFIDYNILNAALYKTISEDLWTSWLDDLFNGHHLPTFKHSWTYYSGALDNAFVVFRDYITLPEETRNRLAVLNKLMQIGMNYWIDVSLTGYATDVHLRITPGYLEEQESFETVVYKKSTLNLSMQNHYGVIDI